MRFRSAAGTQLCALTLRCSLGFLHLSQALHRRHCEQALLARTKPPTELDTNTNINTNTKVDNSFVTEEMENALTQGFQQYVLPSLSLSHHHVARRSERYD